MLDPSCCPPRGVRESPFRTSPPLPEKCLIRLAAAQNASILQRARQWLRRRGIMVPRSGQGVQKVGPTLPKWSQNCGLGSPLLNFYRNRPTVSWTQYLLYILYIGPPKATLFFVPWATQNMSKHRAVLSTLPQPWKRRPCGPKNGGRALPATPKDALRPPK